MHVPRTILLIILILLLIGAFPSWPYSAGWGYYPFGYPFGGIGILLLIVIILSLWGGFKPRPARRSEPRRPPAHAKPPRGQPSGGKVGFHPPCYSSPCCGGRTSRARFGGRSLVLGVAPARASAGVLQIAQNAYRARMVKAESHPT
jgi:hypothetical protein